MLGLLVSFHLLQAKHHIPSSLWSMAPSYELSFRRRFETILFLELHNYALSQKRLHSCLSDLQREAPSAPGVKRANTGRFQAEGQTSALELDRIPV